MYLTTLLFICGIGTAPIQPPKPKEAPLPPKQEFLVVKEIAIESEEPKHLICTKKAKKRVKYFTQTPRLPKVYQKRIRYSYKMLRR